MRRQLWSLSIIRKLNVSFIECKIAEGKILKLTGKRFPIEMVKRIPLNENSFRNAHLECFAVSIVYSIVPQVEAIHVWNLIL